MTSSGAETAGGLIWVSIACIQFRYGQKMTDRGCWEVKQAPTARAGSGKEARMFDRIRLRFIKFRLWLRRRKLPRKPVVSKLYRDVCPRCEGKTLAMPSPHNDTLRELKLDTKTHEATRVVCLNCAFEFEIVSRLGDEETVHHA